MDLFAPAPDPKTARERREQTARIQAWFRAALSLDDDVVLSVNELRCDEPDCPEVETVVGVMGAPGRSRKFRVLRPLAEVTEEDACIAAEWGSAPLPPASP